MSPSSIIKNRSISYKNKDAFSVGHKFFDYLFDKAIIDANGISEIVEIIDMNKYNAWLKANYGWILNDSRINHICVCTAHARLHCG